MRHSRLRAGELLRLAASLAGWLCGFSILGQVNTGAAPVIRLETVQVNAGGSASVAVAFQSAGQRIAALQFDVFYNIQQFAISVTPRESVLGSGKRIWRGTPGSVVDRFVIAGLNQDSIPDGTLATLLVEVKPDTPSGIHPLLLGNLAASSPDGNPIALAGLQGTLVVPGDGALAPLVLGVENAASYTSSAVAPGEIVVIRGQRLGPDKLSLPEISDGLLATSVAGTRVFFDEIAAPVVYSLEGQVAAIVPYALDKHSTTLLRVEYQRVRSAPVSLPVVGSSPALFTVDQSGKGQAVAVNEDGTLNGPDHPAPPGSIIVLYGTGEGQTDPPGTDGRINKAGELNRPLRAATVSVGGQQAEVLYAGSSGEQVCGLLQVNVRVPSSTLPGPAVPIVLTIGSESQAGVTVAIR